ncbi:modification methylase [Thermococcus litoralis DSM 5473]|uniref:DNA (cytosine-5-)-methyltransferase n=1 Tax=Thermococcus litoralis (strain ATCC 51850 / DSM 5473 / JCM 8560 / NS-C) TaxID=523849 RepID=H3ZKW9_THELN|nr:DNA cytosine methyltransferase [Thermococcus litoralis]EHR79370.1 modification methylase [Thermococcus litoralis DSM 5473]
MKVIDLFAGAGGFSRGFKEEGFEIVAAVENFPPKAKTYQINFPETFVFVEDIKRLDAEKLKKEIGEVEVIIGGPPCEPFTAINLKRKENPLDRLYNDPIGRLVLHFIRFLKAFKPAIFVMEEVPQVMEGPLREALQKEFKKAGYEVYFNILDAYDYRTPQIRKRVFISNVPLNPPKVREKLTVWDAIGDLPDPRFSEKEIPNHEYVPLSAKKRRAIAKLGWGEALHSFGGRFKNWIRLHPYKPAPTVRGTSRFIHPFEDRLLTVREQARLMGYPDYHIFLGGRNVQYDSVGESVPPTVARAIAEVVKEMLKKTP